MLKETFALNHWMPLDKERFRTYVFPNGEYRIDNPVKVIIKRKPEGDSHRVVSRMKNPHFNDEGNKGAEWLPVSHYIPTGWIAIRWEGLYGQEEFSW